MNEGSPWDPLGSAPSDALYPVKLGRYAARFHVGRPLEGPVRFKSSWGARLWVVLPCEEARGSDPQPDSNPGINESNGGGKFPIGCVHSLDNVKLRRADREGPRSCFLHGKGCHTTPPGSTARSLIGPSGSPHSRSYSLSPVTFEHEARVGYLETITSARAMDVYVLKGSAGPSGDYVHVGKVEGRQAVDHPYKFHYRYGGLF